MRPTNSRNSDAGEAVEEQRFVGHQADPLLDLELVLGKLKPRISMLPASGGIRPVSMRIVVDLPAPLGPRKPKKQPRGTSRFTPSTAALIP